MKNHIVAIRYGTVDGATGYYLAWEFKHKWSISYFIKDNSNGQDCLRIRIEDMIFLIDPNDGHIIDNFPTHG